MLSVVIPAYNEAETILDVLHAVKRSSVTPLEIVVVDDGSRDGTGEILEKNAALIDVLIIKKKNEGKGAALRTGFQHATGQIVLIQDADLEYDPTEYPNLIEAILQGRADVVYGSRFVGTQPRRVVYFWHYLANVLLTLFSNVWTNLNLTDMETGYKAFRREILQQIEITENSFGIEPEITAKAAALQPRIYEVGIAYHGRTYDEGKKIGAKDFFQAIWVITKFGFSLRLLPVLRQNFWFNESA